MNNNLLIIAAGVGILFYVNTKVEARKEIDTFKSDYIEASLNEKMKNIKIETVNTTPPKIENVNTTQAPQEKIADIVNKDYEYNYANAQYNAIKDKLNGYNDEYLLNYALPQLKIKILENKIYGVGESDYNELLAQIDKINKGQISVEEARKFILKYTDSTYGDDESENNYDAIYVAGKLAAQLAIYLGNKLRPGNYYPKLYI